MSVKMRDAIVLAITAIFCLWIVSHFVNLTNRTNTTPVAPFTWPEVVTSEFNGRYIANYMAFKALPSIDGMGEIYDLRNIRVSGVTMHKLENLIQGYKSEGRIFCGMLWFNYHDGSGPTLFTSFYAVFVIVHNQPKGIDFGIGEDAVKNNRYTKQCAS